MKYLRILCFAVLGALVAACSGDDATDGGDSGKNVTHEPITVKINLSTEAMHSGRGGRAVPEWTDAANEAEMMHKWFVVITEGTAIKAIVEQTCSPTEKDTYSKTVEGLSTKTEYTFYSFANMDLSDVGLSESSTTLPAGFDSKTFKASGNGFDPTDENTKGIPMSNKQTFSSSTFTENKEYEVDLWVVRMYAKVELQIENKTTSTIRLRSVTLSDLTSNANGEGNIKLLPNPLNGADEVACATNLADGAKASDFTFGYGTDQLPLFTSTTSNGTTTFDKVTKETGDIEIGKDATQNIVFYVNESATPTNNHGLFILSLETSNVQSNATNTDATKRYALITTKMDENGGTWDGEIARNDYHIIPITLDDYEFRLDIYQSEGIGVLPYWVYSDGIYTCTFYNGEEHFHITPLIKRISDGVELQYSLTSAAGTWTVDEAGSTEGLPNCWQVVGTENTDIFASETTATHDYDNGGCPRWSSTDHFVFGKFAAQDKIGKSTYKMTVTVNRDGTSPSPAQRQYTYQLCIVRGNLSSSAVSNAKPLTRSRSCLFGYGRAISE